MYVHTCVTAGADDSEHDCETLGPGLTVPNWLTFISFMSQLSFVWMAFLMIPYSSPKGRRTMGDAISIRTTDDHTQTPGGHLKGFMLYEPPRFANF